MKPYFGYIRVSTPKQGRGVSLDEQRSSISALASRNGLKIVAWFVETETAARRGRTEYTKMIKELERGKIGGVIIHKIDRGARNLKDWADLGELIDRGIDVQFAHESIDMRSRGGRLAADIQAVVAADYIRNLRDEVLKGFYGRLKQGVYPLPAPTGYLDRGAGIPKDIDPVAGPLVQYAFERYSKGDIGLDALRLDLASRGLRTPRGQAISHSALAGLLHNPFYLGVIHIKRRKETFQGAHSPLISKALFDRVQDVMAGRHAPKAKAHSFRYKTMIAHIGCTRSLTGEVIKGRYVYYRCHGQGCKGVSLPEGTLDQAIQQTISILAYSPEDMRDLRDMVDDARSHQSRDLAHETASLKLQLSNCDDRQIRLTDALLDGTITKEVFDERKAQLITQKSDLKYRLKMVSDEPTWAQQYRKFELNNTQLLRYQFLPDDEKRDLLAQLCSNLAVEGKTPVIKLQFPYKQIAEAHSVRLGGPSAGDVRTLARRILAILMSSPGTYANDNVPQVPQVQNDSSTRARAD
jgi:site-specific DNA recombinase